MHSNPMKSHEMAEAAVGFKLVRGIMKWRHFPLLLVVVGLKSWLPVAHIPMVFRAAECLLGFFICLFNHHVVFIVVNAIIVFLFITFRGNDNFGDEMNGAGDGFDDLWEHSHKLHTLSPSLSAENSEEKQILFRSSENDIMKCDYLTAAMEEAKKQIDKFQRTQTGKHLRREMAVRPRSEVENHRETVLDIENLSSEDFRRAVDAFIGKHWSIKKWKYGFHG